MKSHVVPRPRDQRDQGHMADHLLRSAPEQRSRSSNARKPRRNRQKRRRDGPTMPSTPSMFQPNNSVDRTPSLISCTFNPWRGSSASTLRTADATSFADVPAAKLVGAPAGPPAGGYAGTTTAPNSTPSV